MTGTDVRTSIWIFPDRSADEIVQAAIAAEDAGMDTFWLGDEGVARDPFTVLTAVGLATTSIELGIAVSNPYMRHPALTASTAATVAEITGRSLHLAFGPGGTASLGPVGLKAVNPVPSLRDALRIARAVLDAKPTEGFEPGSFARREERVDLWMGARGPLLASLAGRDADGFFTQLPKPILGPMLKRVRASRPVNIALCYPLILDEDALRAIRPYLALSLLDAPLGTPEAAGMSRSAAVAAAKALEAGELEMAASYIPDEVVDNIAIYGGPEEAATEFARLAVEHDVDEITAFVWGDDLPSRVESAAAVLRSAEDLI
ncbi:MAG: LLM class flavin-dependent oxidoreductase [Acidimicrobiia bacterium]|nr:LLM class flavin-dependent oxidoreductase [Acidimicrobiia bacterium]